MFKIELHAHTSPVSRCAHADAETLIDRYIEAGYSGIVLTNHINNKTFAHMQNASWKEKAEYYWAAIEEAEKIANGRIDILPGCEVYSNITGNEYLLYGLTYEKLLEGEEWLHMGLAEICESAKNLNMFIVRAHPFRNGARMEPADPMCAIEVYNGLRKHDSHNYLAEVWVKNVNKPVTSGSDFHDPDSVISGGILTSSRIRDNIELLRTLRNGNYALITKG